ESAVCLQWRLRGGRDVRTACRGRGGTHALRLGCVGPSRLEAAPVIGAALERAAAGSGYRPIAAAFGLPATPVRGWLRRARARAWLAARLWRFAHELGARAPRSPPGERPLAALLRGAGAAHEAAALRFGGAGLPDR